MEFSRSEYWSGSHSLLQGIFSSQWSIPGLLHCRWILYHLSHQGSPSILEWVAYPFSRRSPWSRNQTGVSCIAGGFSTSWATREVHKVLTQHANINIYLPIYIHAKLLLPALIFRCIHYFTLYFSLVILEVLFTHPSKQSSGRHLFPLLKKKPPQKTDCAMHMAWQLRKCASCKDLLVT